MYILIMFHNTPKGYKFKLSPKEVFLLAMADARHEAELDSRVEEDKIPLPTALLAHELDNDEMLQDTLLNLCDSSGVPFKYKYLANSTDDVMEIMKCDEFLDRMPMCEEFNYYIARDYMGCPITKSEVDKNVYERCIFEKRAMDIINKQFTLKKQKKVEEPVIQFKKETKVLDFEKII